MPKPRKQSQKYHNTFKFKHNRASKKTQEILSAPMIGFCEKCYKIIQWKKDYRRYKPLTQPKKCIKCQDKCINVAYHNFCQRCCTDHGCCSKCGKPASKLSGLDKEEEKEDWEEFEKKLVGLRVKDRKRLLREKEREIDWEERKKYLLRLRKRKEITEELEIELEDMLKNGYVKETWKDRIRKKTDSGSGLEESESESKLESESESGLEEPEDMNE